MKRITFHNVFGIGDLFESRAFVLDWMKTYGVETAQYHCRYPSVFEDLPQIEAIQIDPSKFGLRDWVSRRGGHIVVGTWIGALNAETNPRGDYVIWPGVGCVVENLYRMHKKYQRVARLKGMKDPIVNYLSDIDYSKINLGGVEEFVSECAGERLILVCNGDTSSQHAVNFSMAQMVDLLPPSDDIFILTERAEVNRPNVFFTDDITQRNGRCDVMAISRLSNFCDVIIGRCSGAQMVCETRKNWMDPSKTLVSFTEHRNGASFVLNPQALGLQMKLVHSTAPTPEEAAEVLKSVL